VGNVGSLRERRTGVGGAREPWRRSDGGMTIRPTAQIDITAFTFRTTAGKLAETLSAY